LEELAGDLVALLVHVSQAQKESISRLAAIDRECRPRFK